MAPRRQLRSKPQVSYAYDSNASAKAPGWLQVTPTSEANVQSGKRMRLAESSDKENAPNGSENSRKQSKTTRGRAVTVSAKKPHTQIIAFSPYPTKARNDVNQMQSAEKESVQLEESPQQESPRYSRNSSRRASKITSPAARPPSKASSQAPESPMAALVKNASRLIEQSMHTSDAAVHARSSSHAVLAAPAPKPVASIPSSSHQSQAGAESRLRKLQEEYSKLEAKYKAMKAKKFTEAEQMIEASKDTVRTHAEACDNLVKHMREEVDRFGERDAILSKEHSRMEAECLEMQHQHRETRRAADAALAQLASAERQLAEAARKEQQLADQVKCLAVSLEEASVHGKEAQALAAQDAQKLSEAHAETMRALELELQEAGEQLRARGVEGAVQDAALEEARARAATLEQAAAALTQKVEERSAEVDTLKAALQLAQSKCAALDEAQAQLTLLTRDLTQSHEREVVLTNQVRNANESIEAAMESLEQANAAAEARASSLEASRRELAHDKEELLQHQAELQAHLEEAQVMCAQQTARGNELEAEKTRLAESEASLNAVISRLQGGEQELGDEVARLRSLERALAGQVSDLGARETTLTAQVATLDARKAELEGETKRLSVRERELATELTRLNHRERQLAEQVSKLEEHEAVLGQDTVQLQCQLEAATAEGAELKEQNAQHAANLEVLRKQGASLSQQLASLQTAHKAVEAEAARTQARVQELEQEVQASSEREALLLQENQKLLVLQDELRKEVACLQMRERELSSRIETVQGEEEVLEKCVENLKSREAKVYTDLERLQRNNRSMVEELQSLRVARVEMQSQLEQAKDALTAQCARVEVSQKQRTATAKELEELRTKVDQWSAVLDAAALEGMFGLQWDKQGPGVHRFLHVASGFAFQLTTQELETACSGSHSKAQEVEYKPLNPEEYMEKLPERFVGVDSITFAIELLPKFFGQLISALN